MFRQKLGSRISGKGVYNGVCVGGGGGGKGILFADFISIFLNSL